MQLVVAVCGLWVHPAAGSVGCPVCEVGRQSTTKVGDRSIVVVVAKGGGCFACCAALGSSLTGCLESLVGCLAS